jgi:hypothetical protein
LPNCNVAREPLQDRWRDRRSGARGLRKRARPRGSAPGPESGTQLGEPNPGWSCFSGHGRLAPSDRLRPDHRRPDEREAGPGDLGPPGPRPTARRGATAAGPARPGTRNGDAARLPDPGPPGPARRRPQPDRPHPADRRPPGGDGSRHVGVSSSRASGPAAGPGKAAGSSLPAFPRQWSHASHRPGRSNAIAHPAGPGRSAGRDPAGRARHAPRGGPPSA